MRKVVINVCYGGFGLSKEALLAYAKRKGFVIYAYTDTKEESFGFTNRRYKKISNDIDWSDQFMVLTVKKDMGDVMSSDEYNKLSGEYHIYDRDIPRDDPDLVAVVEELGSEKSSDRFAELKVVEIPDDVQWSIEEYDGTEWVSEAHETWS